VNRFDKANRAAGLQTEVRSFRGEPGVRTPRVVVMDSGLAQERDPK